MMIRRALQSVTKTTTHCGMFVWMLLLAPAMAEASHGLRDAADEYRDAALALERHVHRLGQVDPYIKRLVSRLENAACDFKAAARDPHDVSRLRYHWLDLLSLHERTEQVLLTGCAAHDPSLRQCWFHVAQALQCIKSELRAFPGCHASTPLPPWQSQRPPVHHPPFPQPMDPHSPYPDHTSDWGTGGWGSGSWQSGTWQSGNGPTGRRPSGSWQPSENWQSGHTRPALPATGPGYRDRNQSAPIVWPAAPYGTTLGTLPLSSSTGRPTGPRTGQPLPTGPGPGRGEVGAAIAIGLLETLLNR